MSSLQGRRCVLKDCCRIEDNTVLPPETVVPPFAVMSGTPACHAADLPEVTPDLMADYTRSIYNHFVMVKEGQSDRAKKDATAKLLELWIILFIIVKKRRSHWIKKHASAKLSERWAKIAPLKITVISLSYDDVHCISL